MLQRLLLALTLGTVFSVVNQYAVFFTAQSWDLVAWGLSCLVMLLVPGLCVRITRVAGRLGTSAGSVSFRDACQQRARSLELLGNTVSEIASGVNKASGERAEIAQSTLVAVGVIVAQSERIDTLTEQTVQRVERLAAQSSAALDDMGDLIQRVRDCVQWSESQTRRMAEFASSFDAIKAMADEIRAVSSQTRLLSLNATIEAARAGASGVGFAVVAAEVKNLSQKSQRQTDRIDDILGQLSGTVQSIAEETQRFSATLEGSLDQVARGEDGARHVRDEMHGALGDVSSSLQEVDDATSTLRGCLDHTSEGMGLLAEGAQQAIAGSARNLEIGNTISAESREMGEIFAGR